MGHMRYKYVFRQVVFLTAINFEQKVFLHGRKDRALVSQDVGLCVEGVRGV